MQTSNQFPEEGQLPESQEHKALSDVNNDIRSDQEADSVLSSADEEAVLQGAIYPPPPAFYLKPHSAQRREAPKISVPVKPSPSAESYTGPQPGYSAIPYPYPYPYARRPQSFILVWVLVGLIGGLVLSACGLFAWISYSFFGETAQTISEAMQEGPITVNRYYGALQEKNYAEAFLYLHPAFEMTQEQFTQQAQERDKQDGAVRSFTTGEPRYEARGEDTVPYLVITVDVEREQGTTYTAHLLLRQDDGAWKIVEFDII